MHCVCAFCGGVFENGLLLSLDAPLDSLTHLAILHLPPRSIRATAQDSATGTRTRVARVRAEYPNQLDYSGSGQGLGTAPHATQALKKNSRMRFHSVGENNEFSVSLAPPLCADASTFAAIGQSPSHATRLKAATGKRSTCLRLLWWRFRE